MSVALVYSTPVEDGRIAGDYIPQSERRQGCEAVYTAELVVESDAPGTPQQRIYKCCLASHAPIIASGSKWRLDCCIIGDAPDVIELIASYDDGKHSIVTNDEASEFLYIVNTPAAFTQLLAEAVDDFALILPA